MARVNRTSKQNRQQGTNQELDVLDWNSLSPLSNTSINESFQNIYF